MRTHEYALRDAAARFEETRRLAVELSSLQKAYDSSRQAHESDLMRAAQRESALEAQLRSVEEAARNSDSREAVELGARMQVVSWRCSQAQRLAEEAEAERRRALESLLQAEASLATAQAERDAMRNAMDAAQVKALEYAERESEIAQLLAAERTQRAAERAAWQERTNAAVGEATSGALAARHLQAEAMQALAQAEHARRAAERHSEAMAAAASAAAVRASSAEDDLEAEVCRVGEQLIAARERERRATEQLEAQKEQMAAQEAAFALERCEAERMRSELEHQMAEARAQHERESAEAQVQYEQQADKARALLEHQLAEACAQHEREAAKARAHYERHLEEARAEYEQAANEALAEAVKTAAVATSEAIRTTRESTREDLLEGVAAGVAAARSLRHRRSVLATWRAVTLARSGQRAVSLDRSRVHYPSICEIEGACRLAWRARSLRRGLVRWLTTARVALRRAVRRVAACVAVRELRMATRAWEAAVAQRQQRHRALSWAGAVVARSAQRRRLCSALWQWGAHIEDAALRTRTVQCVQRQRACRALVRWRERPERGRVELATRALLFRSATARRHKGLCRALMQWASCTSARKASASRRLCGSLHAWTGQGSRRAWNTWHAAHDVSRRLRSSIHAWGRQGVRRAWGTWRTVQSAVAALRRRLLPCFRRLEAMAWRSWIGVARAHRHVLLCLRRSAACLQHRAARRAFSSWHAAYAGELTRLSVRGMLHHAARSMRRRDERGALFQWHGWCASLARARIRLRATTERWRGQGCGRAWTHWHSVYASSRALRRYAACWRQRRERAALSRWSGATAESAWMRGRMRAVLFRMHPHTKPIGQAWRAWAGATRTARTVRRVWSALVHQEFRRAWTTWLLKGTALRAAWSALRGTVARLRNRQVARAWRHWTRCFERPKAAERRLELRLLALSSGNLRRALWRWMLSTSHERGMAAARQLTSQRRQSGVEREVLAVELQGLERHQARFLVIAGELQTAAAATHYQASAEQKRLARALDTAQSQAQQAREHALALQTALETARAAAAHAEQQTRAHEAAAERLRKEVSELRTEACQADEAHRRADELRLAALSQAEDAQEEAAEAVAAAEAAVAQATRNARETEDRRAAEVAHATWAAQQAEAKRAAEVAAAQRAAQQAEAKRAAEVAAAQRAAQQAEAEWSARLKGAELAEAQWAAQIAEATRAAQEAEAKRAVEVAEAQRAAILAEQQRAMAEAKRAAEVADAKRAAQQAEAQALRAAQTAEAQAQALRAAEAQAQALRAAKVAEALRAAKVAEAQRAAKQAESLQTDWLSIVEVPLGKHVPFSNPPLVPAPEPPPPPCADKAQTFADRAAASTAAAAAPPPSYTMKRPASLALAVAPASAPAAAPPSQSLMRPTAASRGWDNSQLRASLESWASESIPFKPPSSKTPAFSSPHYLHKPLEDVNMDPKDRKLLRWQRAAAAAAQETTRPHARRPGSRGAPHPEASQIRLSESLRECCQSL